MLRALEKGKNIRELDLDKGRKKLAIGDLFLLTDKPVLYVANVE
jgi:ribosome-binding ATPase YchF (GTP1/OBG family)